MKRQESKYKLVFVVGCPRSGTTWMMRLLAQHPSVATCFHSGFFHALQPLRDWWEDKAGFGKRVFPASGNGSPDSTPEAQDSSTVNLSSILLLDDFYDYSRPLASYVFNQIAGCGSGTQVVVEKTAENLEFLSWILKIFPEAFVLHVIRDPRSVFASTRKAVHSWAGAKILPTSPVEAARSWCWFVESGKQIMQTTSRYKEVRYEALHSEGPKKLQEIYSWLDLAIDPFLVEQAFHACSIEKLRNDETLPAPQGFFRKGLTEGWREELSASEIRVIEYIAGDHMQVMGYDRSLVPSTRKPLRFWLYEMFAMGLRKVSQDSLSPLRKLARRVPLLAQLQPRRRVQILKRTMAGMLK